MDVPGERIKDINIEKEGEILTKLEEEEKVEEANV